VRPPPVVNERVDPKTIGNQNAAMHLREHEIEIASRTVSGTDLIPMTNVNGTIGIATTPITNETAIDTKTEGEVAIIAAIKTRTATEARGTRIGMTIAIGREIVTETAVRPSVSTVTMVATGAIGPVNEPEFLIMAPESVMIRRSVEIQMGCTTPDP
jgi:hypothetical protein